MGPFFSDDIIQNSMSVNQEFSKHTDNHVFHKGSTSLFLLFLQDPYNQYCDRKQETNIDLEEESVCTTVLPIQMQTAFGHLYS